ncbi:MAG: TIGR00730 family Rossman fold protein [Planctomycetaceae bacterium]|nr:TIGR00730 family Rossman fold protein [Planctomycetaceae bacterium]
MKRICIYCGSKTGNHPAYREAAEELGREMINRNLELVFGAGSIGMMGVVADSVLEAGGTVIGVIPKFLSGREVMHQQMSETHIVESMHERKALMEEMSNGFIALPGGLGTFEELFEILTWSQLGLHRKNVGLLNVRGYFDPLLQQVNHAIAEGFVKEDNRDLFVVSNEPGELLDLMDQHELPEVKRWMTDEEQI